MNINHLRYFKKIAELENMTQASKALNVAQPSLSKTIRTLEEDLHVKLFDRKGKHIVLNQNGRILLKYTNKIINSIEDAKMEIKDSNNIQNNTVTIAVQAASQLLSTILLDLKKHYPTIKLTLIQHANKKHEEVNADLIIYSTKNKVNKPNVITLLEEKILLAVPIDHPFSNRENVLLEELASESFISLQNGMGLREITNYYCQLAGFEPHIILDSDDPATIRGLINVGLGIAFLPAITWQQNIASDKIKLLSISDIDCKRFINISWRQKTYRSKTSKLVCNYMVDFFKNLQS